MWRTVLIVAMLSASATSSFAWVNLEATCSNGEALIYLRIGNTYGPAYSGLVVTRYQMGTCETPVVVTDAPLPLPEDGQVVNITVSAPAASVFYRFEAMLVDSVGDLHTIPDASIQGIPQVPRDLAADGAAVVVRGQLSVAQNYLVYIAPCADGCWGDQTASYLLDETPDWSQPLIWLALARSVVDVVGVPNEPDGTLGPPNDIFVESVQLAPAGSCGVVATEAHSWGSLKAQFR
jgi:hypothetical protein